MNDFAHRHCTRLANGAAPLPRATVETACNSLNGWAIDETASAISKQFRFRNYYETVSFVNAVAWISHREDHHPDIHVGYNLCTVHYTTHAAKGLTDNDFICAAKIDALQA